MTSTPSSDNRAPVAPSLPSPPIPAALLTQDAPAIESSEPDFPIVGIGASAGGLSAFEKFFAGMPEGAAPGMAFVVVQHLEPDHKSILADLVRRYTRMVVVEVRDDMLVEPDHVYIIPPGQEMTIFGGHLHLREPDIPRGQRLSIDHFFRSLARERGDRSIGIVLSGTGSDGTLGIRAIKSEGGMAFAQSIESTEYDGMPRSAISTGLVDFVLDPADMAPALVAYAASSNDKIRTSNPFPKAVDDDTLRKIFAILRSVTTHDFSQYKAGTVVRRIERRMSVQRIETLENYARLLEHTPAEVGALFHDLLIGVTTFFRDRAAFDELENAIIPSIMVSKPPELPIRVWSAGCSTGEEAYSMAMLFAEYLENTRQMRTIQIFATDIDPRAIAMARAGVFLPEIAQSVGAERLARHFLTEPDGVGLRIRKNIRDMLVFSEQDLIKDPPFSKLDMVSCRNLLIYFDPSLQQKLFPLFHYALNPGGVLFLGSAETVGEDSNLFSPIDRKTKFFRRNGDPTSSPGAPSAPMGRVSKSQIPSRPVSEKTGTKALVRRRPSLRETTEQALLSRIAPATALVNAQGDILYLHGRMGAYLEPAPGEVGVSNILKMAREGLQRDVGFGLRKAVSTGKPVKIQGLRIRTHDSIQLVDLGIHPLDSESSDPTDAALYLVILAESSVSAIETTTETGIDSATENDARIVILTRELRMKEEYLEAANGQLESSNQELKSANEEMMSVNEEMQSTNEELETSKEELQSVNEELATVNVELQTKLVDLSRANNDMNNLLAGTGIGTVFVDLDLRVIRYTPAATRMINLIPGDLGRPLAHILPNLDDYRDLVQDTREVLRSLVPKDVEVRTRDGGWFTMRILPYRTLENVVEGAVITFVDISEAMQARELVRLAAAVRDSRDAIVVQDAMGRILAWNPGAVRMYGWSETEAMAMDTRDRIPAKLREQAMEKLKHLSQASTLEPVMTQRMTKDSTVLQVSVVSTALLDASGKMYAISTTERPLGADLT